MSKNRLGIYTNLNLSNLNQSDNIVNTTGLLDGCEIILFTSSDMKNAITLNTSDSTSPKVIKQQPSEDKKDAYTFKLVADKAGYLLKSTTGGWYVLVNSNKQVYGNKNSGTVFLISNLGGKMNIKCKLRVLTTNNEIVYLAERGDNIVATSDDSNNQWNIEFTSFGDKAFRAVLYDNKDFQKFCCDGKGKTAVCKLEGFTSDSSKCKSLGPMPSDRYLEDDFDEEDFFEEDDMEALNEYAEDEYAEDDDDFDEDEDDMQALDNYVEEDFDISDANINVNTISKSVLLSLIVALVILIAIMGLFEFQSKWK